MASLYRKPCADTMREDGESDYQADGLWNKYAERLDACDFFTGCGKKNGAVNFCAIAYCYWLFVNIICDDHVPDDNERKWATHYFMYQSDSCCTAAGCEQQVQVYKNNGAWHTDPKDLVVGDQIFFWKWSDEKGRMVYYHTGGCYDWDDNGVYVTEANTNGGRTENKFYPYSEFGNKIGGYGHPRFDGYELTPNDDNVSNPTDNNQPDPEPTPEPNLQKRMVKVGDYLAVRTGPSTDYEKIGELNYGAVVYIFETSGNWARIGDNMWVSMSYLV